MSMLAKQVMVNRESFRELQKRALRVSPERKEKSQGLGAVLFPPRQTGLEASSFLAQALMTSQESALQALATRSTEWLGTGLGSAGRFADVFRRIVTLQMTHIHEQGPFGQGPVSDDLVALKHTAEQKNYKAFARLARLIDWSRYSPRALTQAIDVALAADMVHLARELSLKGRELFPSDERVQQAARVLCPPLLVRMRPHQTTDFETSQRWLTEHAAEYKGKWVAVRDGQLLASAATLTDLYQQIGSGGRGPRTIIVKVLS